MKITMLGATALRPPLGPRDHRQGSLNAPAVLVEYGDYECPYCGEAYPIVKELQRLMGERLCFVFRHFPIIEKHAFALPAAEAAEAAGAQGKFWEMHDMLYEHQDRLQPPDLLRYAASLRLDLARFERDLVTHAFQPRVIEDLESGLMSGVNGTPTFFINGVRYLGEYDLRSLLTVLQEVAGQPVR